MRNVLAPYVPGRVSAGLFFVRIFVGLAFVFHGYPKIVDPTAWMGTHTLTAPWTGASFGPLPDWLQALVAFVEFFGGIALIVGFLTRFAAFALLIDMIVACLFVEVPRGTPFVASGHTLEPNLAYIVTTLLIVLAGPGAVAIDALAGRPSRVQSVQDVGRAA
jgi:putative oxidoreductase